MINDFKTGLIAFEKNDFELASNIWCSLISKSVLDTEQLNIIYQKCTNALKSHPQNEWNYIILCGLFLDYSDYFVEDRENGLLDVVSWGKLAIDINGNNHQSQRYTGSALYWLNDYEAAQKYYKKSNQLYPQIDLQVRLFNIASDLDPNLPVTDLQISFTGDKANEYYVAGVALGHLVNSYDNEQEKKYLKDLLIKIYERSYELYYDYLINKTGNPHNSDGHTFAMCCNNLSIYYNEQNRHQEAVTILNEGLKFSEFEAILHNLMYSYNCKGEKTKREEIAIQLLKDYQLDTNLFFECLFYATAYFLKKGDATTAIEYAILAEENYLNISFDEYLAVYSPQYFALAYANKIIAEANLNKPLGAMIENVVDEVDVDNLTEHTMAAAVYLLQQKELPDYLWFDSIYYGISYYLDKNENETALYYANLGLEQYIKLDMELQQNERILSYFTIMYSNKILAEERLGILDTNTINVDIMDNALNEKPDDPYQILNKGRLYHQSNQHEKALDSYNQGIQFAKLQEKDSAIFEGLKVRGHLYLYYLKQYELALEDYLEIEKLGKADFNTYYFIADANLKLGNFKLVLEAIESGIPLISPEDRSRLDIMNYFYSFQGDAYYGLEEFALAIQAYEESLSYCPDEVVESNLRQAKRELGYRSKNTGIIGRLFGKK